MRNFGETWEAIVNGGEYQMDTVAEINNIDYSTITAPTIESSLLTTSGLSVGNCVSATARFTVMTNNVIPQSSKVVIKSRVRAEQELENPNMLLDTNAPTTAAVYAKRPRAVGQFPDANITAEWRSFGGGSYGVRFDCLRTGNNDGAYVFFYDNFADNFVLQPNTTYTLSAHIDNLADNGRIKVWVYSNEWILIEDETLLSGSRIWYWVFTTPNENSSFWNESRQVQFRIDVFNTSSSYGYIYMNKWMLNEGSTYLPWNDGNNEIHSDWVEFGTYWINTRETDDDMKLIDLVCYDAMMRGNQPYVDDSALMNWPKSISTVVTRIAEQMDVDIDSRTTTDIINSATGAQEIVTKPNDDETLLDILSHIGEVLGGNWIITPDNELRFVQLASAIDEDTYYVLSEEGDRIVTVDDHHLVYRDSSGGGGGGGSNASGADVCTVPVVLGTITTGQRYTISRVTMTVSESDSEIGGYTAGDDSGYELLIENNPYASQAICNALYAIVDGVEYLPYTMTGAVYDPAVELGDRVIAEGRVYGVLYTETRKLGITFSGDMSAPGDNEIASEYQYVTQTERIKKSFAQIESDYSSKIEQAQDHILLEVTQKYGEVDVFVPQNLLLDSNAPDTENVDLPDTAYRSLDIGAEWKAIDTDVEGLEYGAEFETTESSMFIAWFGTDVGAIELVPGNRYTISCYARATSFDEEMTLQFSTTRSTDSPQFPIYSTGELGEIEIGNDDDDNDVLLLGSNEGNGTRSNEDAYYSWQRIVWTFEAPTDSSAYYGGNTVDIYFYVNGTDGEKVQLCGFMLQEGALVTDWDDGVSVGDTPVLATVKTVQSRILQTADAIRLKADKIVWESTYSSMSESGILTCRGANIYGEFHAEANGYGVTIDDMGTHYIDGGSEVGFLSYESSGTIPGLILNSQYDLHLLTDYGTGPSIDLEQSGASISLRCSQLVVTSSVSGNGYAGVTTSFTLNSQKWNFVNGLFIGFGNIPGL